MQEAINSLSWEELSKFATNESDIINGPNNSYSLLRLFNNPKESVRVTLFRDNHAWCPYCQKVWLWLESKKIPYEIKKVTMRCYGDKEKWYLKKVPSGILPAIELDQNLITESDEILLALEAAFGQRGMPLKSSKIIYLRNLERKIFRAWCTWLCNPSINNFHEGRKEAQFRQCLKEMDKYLSTTKTPWLDPSFQEMNANLPGGIDIIFIPYLERMNASLAYYKGIQIRNDFEEIDKWFQAFEQLEIYRGTQGDFHTHAHDLPPQMGGCWKNKTTMQKTISEKIDIGEGLDKQEIFLKAINNEHYKSIALSRVLKHRQQIIKVNPMKDSLFDQPLRASLTTMITGQICRPSNGSASSLRYLRDRISVPRDMPLLSARELRKALEITASLDGTSQSTPIPFSHRFDQSPIPFSKNP